MSDYQQDLDRLGRNIQQVVDQAVNSRNYRKLEQTVRDIVGENAAYHNRKFTPPENRSATVDPKQLYAGTFGKGFLNVLKVIPGVPLTIFAAASLIAIPVTGEHLVSVPFSVALFSSLFLAGLWLSISGVTTLKRFHRFKVYRRTLGKKTHCSLEKLALAVGKGVKFVRKDLLRMIRSGLFREGHLDREQITLITSNETFRYYETSRMQLETRQQQIIAEEAAARERKKHVKLEPQTREVLEKGNEFLNQIRKCNDDIPGAEISEKIYRIEILVQRIFARAESHPEIIPDLKKLMNYYLPMTVKLLTAYAEMDAQPVQGETILASKQEIEATLDTLNGAFERLLDSVFTDTAMDVSSDISVLQTLLAQEGLTGDEFTKGE